MSANETQVGGGHYKSLSPEPWDVIWAWKRDYLVGSAIKYLSRWESKGGIEDLRKAVHFINKRIELAEEERAAEHRRVEQRMATLVAEVPRADSTHR